MYSYGNKLVFIIETVCWGSLKQFGLIYQCFRILIPTNPHYRIRIRIRVEYADHNKNRNKNSSSSEDYDKRAKVRIKNHIVGISLQFICERFSGHGLGVQSPCIGGHRYFKALKRQRFKPFFLAFSVYCFQISSVYRFLAL